MRAWRLVAGISDNLESGFQPRYLVTAGPGEAPQEMAVSLARLALAPIELEKRLHWARTGREAPNG